MQRFTREIPLSVSADEAFAWHARPGAFERLLPPWQRVRVLERQGGLEVGARLKLRLPGLLPIAWLAEHTTCVPGRSFTDVQRRGPFHTWEHTHEFVPCPDGTSILRDTIHYRLPGGAWGAWLGSGRVGRELRRMFRYRQTVTREDLAMHAAEQAKPRQRVALSGSSGLVGTALRTLLTTGGHTVRPLVRRAAGVDEIPWDPQRGVAEAAAFEGLDAVIHLAGENIAAGRWTSARKAAIRESRVAGTRSLVDSLARVARRPRTFLCASAVGIYGSRGDEVLTEGSASGEGFLAEVARAWEAEAMRATELGMRVVLMRIGVVLSPTGGMLRQVLPPFQLGAGGPVGNGTQWLSWISLDDVSAAMHHVLLHDEVHGPVNLVAPTPVTNAEFARTLGHVLGRPTVLRVPEFVVRTMFGEMGVETVLASVRATPQALERSGFCFRHATLEVALRHVLGRAAE
ncbi:MAG: TIGR01777 family protein [Phycisphaerales bacterium]|nr:TIGR01777 family protein [Phycisphaerales bacterium]